MDSVERTIQFYSIWVNDAHTARRHVDQVVLWRRVKAMATSSRSTHFPKDHRHLSVDVKVAQDGSVEGRMKWDRTADLPLHADREQDTERPLQLGRTGALREAAHWVWWDISSSRDLLGRRPAPLGIIAVERNPRAPKVKDLVRWVGDKFPGQFSIHVQELVDRDVLADLLRSPVKSLKARVHNPGHMNLESGHASGLYVADDIQDVAVLEWRLRPSRGGMFDLSAIVDALTGLLDAKEEDTDAPEMELWVETADGAMKSLIETKMVHRVAVPRLDRATKAIDRSAMIAEIRAAYAEARTSIFRVVQRELTI